MVYRVKYWPKDESFTAVENENPNKNISYDGRSSKFKDWLKSGRVIWTWNDNSTAVDTEEGMEKSAIIFAIFEQPKRLGIIK